MSSILFIRSTHPLFDSRLQKEVNSALKFEHDVILLGWNRENISVNGNQLKMIDGFVDFELCKIKARYGDGIKNIFKLFLFQIWILYKLVIHRKKYRIIHSCDFDTAIPAFIVAKLFRKKIVYDIYDYYTHSHFVPKPIEKIIESGENFIINSSDAVIICNDERREQIIKTHPKKCVVIHNTPDVRWEKQKNRICKSDNSNFKIVYVGILQPGRLLYEIANIITHYPNIELHIGGFGNLENEFYELSKKYSNVFFYGRLPYNQVLQLESECDLLFAIYDPTIKNHKFSAPNKVYEAMALKKPIIVCKDTGVDKMVTRHQIGLAINYNAQAFIAAVQELMKNPALRDEMGSNGRKAYEMYYRWPIMEERLEDIYSNLNIHY